MNQLHPVFANILRDVTAIPAAARAASDIPVPAPRWPNVSTVARYGNPHGSAAAAAHQAQIDADDEQAEREAEWVERRAEQIMQAVAGSDLAATVSKPSGRTLREGEPVDELAEALFAGDDVNGAQVYSVIRRALVLAAKAHVKRTSKEGAGEALCSALWQAACDVAEQQLPRGFA